MGKSWNYHNKDIGQAAWSKGAHRIIRSMNKSECNKLEKYSEDYDDDYCVWKCGDTAKSDIWASPRDGNNFHGKETHSQFFEHLIAVQFDENDWYGLNKHTSMKFIFDAPKGSRKQRKLYVIKRGMKLEDVVP